MVEQHSTSSRKRRKVWVTVAIVLGIILIGTLVASRGDHRLGNTNSPSSIQKIEEFVITEDYMTHYCYNVNGACAYTDYWEVDINNTGNVPITNVVATASTPTYTYTANGEFLVDVIVDQSGSLQGVSLSTANPLLPNHLATMIDNNIAFGYGQKFNVTVTATFSDGNTQVLLQTVTEEG